MLMDAQLLLDRELSFVLIGRLISLSTRVKKNYCAIDILIPMNNYNNFNPLVNNAIFLPPVTLATTTSHINDIQYIQFDFSQYTIGAIPYPSFGYSFYN